MARRTGRILAALGVLALALTAGAGAHLYVAQRLVLDPGVPEPLRSALLASIAALGLAMVLHPLAERLLTPPLLRIVMLPPLLWMGLLFLLLNLLLVSDALLWMLGVAAPPPEHADTPLRVRALVVLGLGGLATGAGLRSALRPPAVREVEVRLPRLPRALDGFRIVQLSDIHIGPILGRRFARELVDRVNALEPDLVAVTGDLVDGPVARLRDEVAPFAGLSARHGTFFVTGNHDHYSGADSWVERVAELGWIPLRNRRVVIDSGAASFELAGVDDHRGDFVGGAPEDLDAALAGRDPSRVLVLLAHDPSTWKRAARRNVDLQLSGHTHGGQIWPFRFLVRLVVPFVAGRYREGSSQLYVSCGTGFWGPPLRLFAPAEITRLTLRV